MSSNSASGIPNIKHSRNGDIQDDMEDDDIQEIGVVPAKHSRKHKAIHNMVERMRRYRMSTCIASIAATIPTLDESKLDKSTVLETAVKYLQFIRTSCANIELIDEAYLAQYGERSKPAPTSQPLLDEEEHGNERVKRKRRKVHKKDREREKPVQHPPQPSRNISHADINSVEITSLLNELFQSNGTTQNTSGI